MGKRNIDWEAIGKDYRLGQKTLRALADQYKVSHVSIIRKAKKEEWVQDKSEEVRTKTKAALLKATKEATKKATTPTKEDIETAVQTNIEVIRGHRKQIGSGLKIVELLSSQLTQAAEIRDDLTEMVIKETATGGKDDGPDYKKRSFMLKAISLPAHAGTLRDLSQAIKNLIPLERQAFGIDDNEKPNENPIIELLNQITQNKKPLVKDED
jgi:hypothetical protein